MLRKKKVKNESEVENWISKYDQDMDEKEREITALRAIYEEERKEMMQGRKEEEIARSSQASSIWHVRHISESLRLQFRPADRASRLDCNDAGHLVWEDVLGKTL